MICLLCHSIVVLKIATFLQWSSSGYRRATLTEYGNLFPRGCVDKNYKWIRVRMGSISKEATESRQLGTLPNSMTGRIIGQYANDYDEDKIFDVSIGYIA